MKQISYSRHRFPGSIIQHAVWLYFRFPLSFRDVEDLLTERGIDVSYESVRRWSVKFGLAYATSLDALDPDQMGDGISTRCLSPSMASACIFGVLLIARAKCWISWFNRAETRRLR